MLVRLCVLGVLPVEADDPNEAIKLLEHQLFHRAEGKRFPIASSRTASDTQMWPASALSQSRAAN